jgi:hypothetical protein
VVPCSSEGTDCHADLILCGNGDQGAAARLPAGVGDLWGLAAEQGYVIFSDGRQPVILFARTPTGLLYAGTTLLQLMSPRGDAASLPNVTVKDWPEYRWRGGSWLLRAEIGGWSYARGDGLRAYEGRVIRKLDLCAMHKINFLHFDGYDWNADRLRGYATMMRRLNHAARLRGIRLSFTGCGAVGDGFQNRRRYPDGPTYACIGQPGNPERCNGTCLSNRALTRGRQARMEEFVRQVRPGAIYLHGIDTGRIDDSAPIWGQRCAACRNRWPNDDIVAPDGMAGAYAAFYDAMAEAIHGVDPDCLLTVVSPCYTAHEETDAEWEQGVQYWLTVSRCLKDSGIHFGLREQFAGETGALPRYAGLRDRLEREAKGHRIACLHFFAGDCFYNSHPFVATPILSRYFEGADVVVHGSGHAYQEAQQLLNAECLWNPRGSRYFSAPKLQPFAKLRRRYRRLSAAEDRPAGIWGAGGFLDDACARLYGPKAGVLVAQIHRMTGTANLRSPGVAPFDHPVVMMPVFNYLHPSRKSFRQAGIVWQRDLGDRNRAQRLAAVYRDVANLNRRAVRMGRRAPRLCDDAEVAADLGWMADTLDAARRCAEILGPFVELFLRAHDAARRGLNRHGILAEIALFNRRLDSFERAMRRALPRGRTLPDDMEVLTRRYIAQHLRQHLSKMEQTFVSGNWPSERHPIDWKRS